MYNDTTAFQDKLDSLIYTLLGRQFNSSCKDCFPSETELKG
jgi:hypothetical protein